MKYLKFYETHKSIENLCNKYKIKNYTINSDHSIDVDGNVDLKGRKYWVIFKDNRSFTLKSDVVSNWTLTEIPLNFRNVNGSFDCRYNEISSLNGCPKRCNEFYISNNKIKSLKGSPTEVSRFLGGSNPLKSLEGGPKICHGDYNVDECELTSLKGSPEIITDGYFGFDQNDVHTLDYLPKMNISKTIFMGKTPIRNLCELFVSPSIHNNFTISELRLFFRSLDYGYLKDNVIDLYRLSQACEEAGIEVPDSIDGYIFQ